MRVEGNTTSCNGSLVINGSQSVFCHQALPGLSSNIAAVQGIRITSVSGMMSDIAALNSKEGKVSGVQSPQGIPWTTYALNGWNTTASSAGAVTKMVEKGIYGFLKPHEETDFDFRNQVEVTATGVVAYAGYPLVPNSDYLVIYSNITTILGRDLYYTACWGIEYLTTDTWRELRNASVSSKDYENSIDMMKSIVQWHENPLHLGDIWEAIKSAGGDLIKSGVNHLFAALPEAAQSFLAGL